MNVIRAVQLYLEKMVADAGPGMKMLMMDRETVSAPEQKSQSTVSYHMEEQKRINYCYHSLFSDQHRLDGLLAVGDAPERSVPVREDRFWAFQRAAQIPKVYRFHPTDTG